MPRDMAMHDPQTWIVRPESNGDITRERKQGNITTWRVIIVKHTIGQVFGRIASILLGQDHEVMAVQMHWMRGLNKSFGFLSPVKSLTAHRDDHVDPVVLLVVFGHQTVFFGVPGVVMNVVDGRVGEIQSHGGTATKSQSVHLPPRKP